MCCRCGIVVVVITVCGGMEGGDENFSRALQEMHVDNSESHIREVINFMISKTIIVLIIVFY